jgi:competence protein ComEC
LNGSVADQNSTPADSVTSGGDGPGRSLPYRFKSPLALLAASFASGIVWAHYLQATVGIYAFLAGAAATLLIGLIILHAGWGRTALCFALAGMTLTGVAAARRWEQRFPLNHVRYLGSMGVDLTSPVRLRGRVISTPYHTGYGSQFDVEAHQVEELGQVRIVTGKIRLRVQGTDDREDSSGSAEIQFGDEIQALVRLQRPHIYQNPGSFDFRRWMEDIEDIYWVGTVRNPRLVEKLGHPAGFHFAEFVEHVRQRLLRGIDDIYPPWSAQGRNGAVLKAVLWGDRTALDSTTIEDFRKTGLYHLLVIAGLHVGLLTLLVEFLLRWLGFRRVTRAFMVLAFLLVYAFLVEQRAATLRATLMIALYLMARILDRDHSPLNAIGGVALILLYLRPPWLFESGFQLSFSAALLIVAVAVPILERTTEPYRRALLRLDDILLDDRFSPRIAQVRLDLRSMVNALRRRVRFLNRFPALSRNMVVAPLKVLMWAANIMVFSAVLQLGLMLPMVETFHRVTFAGVGLNAGAIPLMTVLLGLALPINLLSVASPALAAWPAKLLSMVMALLFAMTHLPGMAAWLSYRMPAPPLWVAWGFCVAFVLAGVALRFAPRAVGAALVAGAIFVGLVAVHPFASRQPRGALQMTVLDCGSGESAFVLLPDGASILLDAGGSRARGAREGGFQGRRWDSGEDIVSPYLWSLGIKRIDVVAITRASPDHLGGIYAILENFRVGEFWHPASAETPEYAELLEKVAERGIPTRTLMAGDALNFGSATVRVLWPGPDSGNLKANVAAGFSPAPGNSGVALTLRSAPAGREAGDTSAPAIARPKAVTTSVSRDSDDSLALRISAKGMNFLIPGDGGKIAQEGMLDSHEPLESQVLTVAHHGTKSSSSAEFLARVAPRVAIVNSESGADTRGSNANSDLLESLQSTGARIFRIDLDGATTVEWKDGGLTVRTFTGTGTVIFTGVGESPAVH